MSLRPIHRFSVQFSTGIILFPISVKYMTTGVAVGVGQTCSSLGFRKRNHKKNTNSLLAIPLPL
jgi:hypothetical protein